MIGRRPGTHAAALAALLFLALMVVTGARPRQQQFVAYEAAGVLEASPAAVRAIEIVAGRRHWRLDRADGTWRLGDASLPPAAVEQLELALKVLHVSRSVRRLREFAGSGQLAEYGLASPAVELKIEVGGERAAGIAFGGDTPDGRLRYLRVAGSPHVELVSTFVFDEWRRLADLLPRGG